MGALTSCGKRGDNCFSSSKFSSPYNSPDFNDQRYQRFSKKLRISSLHLNTDQSICLVSPQRIVSRIRRYPEPTHHIRREVHAPCRKPKFHLSTVSGPETRLKNMGNFLCGRFEKKKSFSPDTSQNLRKDKEVIDVDEKGSKDAISEDSSIEELQILNDGHEGEGDGRSVVSDQRSLETSGDFYLNEKYENFSDYHPQTSSLAVSDLTNQTPKVDDVEKMLESLTVSHGLEEIGMLPHKKLYESAERRNAKLDSLAYDIGLEKKKLPFFSTKLEDVIREPFVPLTDEEEAEVSHAFKNPNRGKVLVTHESSNIEITVEILQCLRPGAWLNDEVINVYLELLKEREKREPKKFLKCHFFNTFFYKKLFSGRNAYDFKAVQRWTTQRKIGYGLVECDKIFVPIHKEVHWCLAVINKKDQKFQYLDSLKGKDTRVLKVLAKYFVDEVKDKNGEDFDVSSWKQEFVDGLPEQENGWDCGMFMIKYADFYSRDLELNFNQGTISYFRRRTAKEILRLKAE